MQQEIKMARQRLVIARLTMMLGRKLTASYLDEEENFDNVPDMVLSKAVFIGQLEGKPMTAAKLAAYVGIPRPTVVRRLNALVERGLVEKDSAGKFTIPAARMNSPERLARVRRVIEAVKRAAADLSEMDAAEVETTSGLGDESA